MHRSTGTLAQASGVAGGRRAHGPPRLSPQEEEIIKVSFESFSEEIYIEETKEKVRTLTATGLRNAFKAIDAESDIHDVQMLIDDIDENGDGMVDESEWRNIMSRKFMGEDDDSTSLIQNFMLLDDNKDGYIPLVELRTILMREGQAPLSEQEVDELLMFADTESDGLINYRTFLRWLQGPQIEKKLGQDDILAGAPVVPEATGKAPAAAGEQAAAGAAGAAAAATSRDAPAPSADPVAATAQPGEPEAAAESGKKPKEEKSSEKKASGSGSRSASSKGRRGPKRGAKSGASSSGAGSGAAS
jgi:Ca2+-binding EF-hand superfamily protein